MKSRSLFDSFRFAMDGFVHALKAHRHMRYMLLLTAMVLLASQILAVDGTRLVCLMLAIGLWFIAELMNAAIEAAVDITCTTYHPLAKVAKDIAASAVLVATVICIFIGALVFLETPLLTKLLRAGAEQPGPRPLHVALVGSVLVTIFVVLGKIWGKKGTLWRGGAVSGHTALAAYLFGAIVYKTGGNQLIFGMAFVLAFLVAQSRLEAGFHTLREVLIGGMVGLAVSAAMLHYLAGV